MNRNYIVARKGEQIVFDLLSGARWVNGENDKNLKYDFLWRDIKVSVKTRGISGKVGTTAFLFSSPSKSSKGVVNVFIALDENRKYFWVSKNDKTFYAKIKDALTGDRVAEEILKVAQK